MLKSKRYPDYDADETKPALMSSFRAALKEADAAEERMRFGPPPFSSDVIVTPSDSTQILAAGYAAAGGADDRADLKTPRIPETNRGAPYESGGWDRAPDDHF